MGERVVVRQNRRFETGFQATDPHNPDDPTLHGVGHIHEMTPYGLLLAGLGTCTAIILHTYAQNHGLDLEEVEIHLEYGRSFAEDCPQCERIEAYREHIEESIAFRGNLSDEERRRLFLVSRHCPIHKMLGQGIEIRSSEKEE